VRREYCPHFTSPEERNWSIMTWATFTKSPNCASQSTTSVSAPTEYPYSKPITAVSVRGELWISSRASETSCSGVHV